MRASSQHFFASSSINFTKCLVVVDCTQHDVAELNPWRYPRCICWIYFFQHEFLNCHIADLICRLINKIGLEHVPAESGICDHGFCDPQTNGCCKQASVALNSIDIPLLSSAKLRVPNERIFLHREDAPAFSILTALTSINRSQWLTAVYVRVISGCILWS